MKCATAPVFGSDIGDGFGEVPAMAVKVLRVILTLAVGMIPGFGQNDGPILPRALAMCSSIFDANLNNVRLVRHGIAFSDGQATIASLHLDTVIGDTESDREAESLQQPIGRGRGVGINEHRNHGTGWHRSVESHLETLSLNQRGKLEWREAVRRR